MQIVQRVFLLMMVVMILLTGITYVYNEQENKEAGQWEKLQTELYLERICRQREITIKEYLRYFQLLNYTGMVSEVRIEEYRKEQDLMGNTYYYLVLWEEVKEQLLEGERYTLLKDSVMCITVKRKNRKEHKISEYYGIVTERE